MVNHNEPKRVENLVPGVVTLPLYGPDLRTDAQIEADQQASATRVARQATTELRLAAAGLTVLALMVVALWIGA